MLKTMTFYSTLIAIACAISVSAYAMANEPRKVDVPAGELTVALQKLAEQSGVEFVYSADQLAGVRTNGVHGDYTAEKAVTKLLEGTELKLTVHESGALLIAPPALSTSSSSSAPAEGANPGNSARTSWLDRFRLAQANTTSERSENPNSAETQPTESDKTLDTSSDVSNGKVQEEVVVIGSHIRGVQNNTVPLTVLDRAYIDSTGFSTTIRLLESLPQNFSLNSQSVVNVPGISDALPQASSVTLRGVSEGTTLILLNGRRMAPGFRSAAVDISAVPLSAIERVEVLTDGASALYGSDAVGGVVNFVLRSDFEGAETRLRSGWADSVNEYRLSQTLGNVWGSGNALLSVDYYKRDLLWTRDRAFVPSTSIVGSLLPKDRTYSALFSGKQELAPALSLFADALYTQRDSENFGGSIISDSHRSVVNPQSAATLGLDWQLGGDWQLEVAGNYAKNSMDMIARQISGGRDLTTNVDSLFEIRAAQIKADGSLLQLPGGSVRTALGAEWRSESYQDLLLIPLLGLIVSKADSEQTVRSAFAEVYVPIVGADNALPGVRRLELSLAGRFDDYSNFGSSFDPQVGVMWEPVDGLRFRASRGTSYKAPNLVDYSLSSNAALATLGADEGFPGGVSYQLQVLGNAVGLTPQQSEGASIGVELVPKAARGLRLGLNYYDIEYTDRIGAPLLTPALLINPAFSSLYIRDPSVAQVNEFIATAQPGRGFFDGTPGGIFTPELIDVIVDLRRRNLNVVETSGLDVSMHYDLTTAAGAVQLGLVGTHVFDRVERITPTSPPFDTADTIYNPPGWRMRGSLGWQQQGWAANLFVNHTDSYTDNRRTAPVPVSSFTTADARLAYGFKERFSGFLSGVTVLVNVQNAFDRDPPAAAVILNRTDMGFDPTNASPLGRLVAVEFAKIW